MVEISPLNANFGAEIHGADLSAGVDDALLALITQTLYDNRIVVIRDQRLSKAEQIAFTVQFGELFAGKREGSVFSCK